MMTSHATTWSRVEELLRGAFADLSSTSIAGEWQPSGPSFLTGSPGDFFEFLEHNELELAWDELALLGRRNQPSADFWPKLALAAEAMNLQGKAAEAMGRSPVEG